jgi:uncharacterized membrane protein YgcG
VNEQKKRACTPYHFTMIWLVSLAGFKAIKGPVTFTSAGDVRLSGCAQGHCCDNTDDCQLNGTEKNESGILLGLVIEEEEEEESEEFEEASDSVPDESLLAKGGEEVGDGVDGGGASGGGGGAALPLSFGP